MTPEEQAALFYMLAYQTSGGLIWTRWPGFPDPRSHVAVQVEQIAALKVRTGTLIVCDPTAAMFPEDCPPLTERFPSGDWPVLLCRAPLGTADEAAQMLCVGALVRFGTGEPVRWAEDRSHEYGVDAGAACFMDAAALPSWGWLMNTEDNPDNRLDEYSLAVGAWNEVPVEGENGTAVNVILFSSGYGDGSYPVFVGYDGQDNVCAVLTVFDVFDAEASSKEVGRGA